MNAFHISVGQDELSRIEHRFDDYAECFCGGAADNIGGIAI